MNNPPAFPHVADILQVAGNSAVVKTLTQNGMTLRDYFAAKAMQVILQSQYEDGIYVGDGDNDSEHMCANSAYIMADAMLKAREA
jgi:hypothetical protein